MSYIKPFVAVAFTASLIANGSPDPKPVVLISTFDMPKSVPVEYSKRVGAHDFDKAISLYHSLRNDFGISHTVFSAWLGVKRRTMYNWLNSPINSTKFGPEIEKRLGVLGQLRDLMEPEHRKLLFKIAYSPIHGNTEFGRLIHEGASLVVLESYYEDSFTLFEDYRLSNT
jgi:hypothetical protein